MTIQRIRVPARWSDCNGNRYDPIYFTDVAEFQLGLGPCGKTVERLDINFHAHGVEIVQVCTCTEQKTFLYPWHTVTGRVEVTHG
jgi:hypothetical protein